MGNRSGECYQPIDVFEDLRPQKGRGVPIFKKPPPPPPLKKPKPEFQTMYDLLVDAEKYEAKGSIVITNRLLGILKECIDDFITTADAN